MYRTEDNYVLSKGSIMFEDNKSVEFKTFIDDV